MLLTDGPKPVAFDFNGQPHLIQTTIINGKNTLRVIAEMVKLDKKNAADLTAWDVLATTSDVRYMPLHLELNCTKNGKPITREEANAIFETLNVIELEDMLVSASGYRELKNSALAREENQQAES